MMGVDLEEVAWGLRYIAHDLRQVNSLNPIEIVATIYNAVQVLVITQEYHNEDKYDI